MTEEFRFEWKKKRGKHICMFCGGCIASCPNFPNRPIRFKRNEGSAFDDEIIHDPKKCSGCGMCAKACPEGMIKLIK